MLSCLLRFRKLLFWEKQTKKLTERQQLRFSLVAGLLTELKPLMKFAKVVFWIAAIYGLVAITPLYFIFDKIGQQDPPPITHPGFYYGFAGVTLAWQIAFIFIARDPVRLRPMMVPSILEKLGFSIAIIVLYLQHRVHPADLGLAGIDLLLAVLFMVAFAKTKEFNP